MSQLADTSATSSTSPASDPVADWGDTAADWRGRSFKKAIPGERVEGKVSITWDSSLAWNEVQLGFSDCFQGDLVPGDGSFLGTLNFIQKRVTFWSDGLQYFVSALPTVDDKKMVHIYQAGSGMPNGPTPWVAEEWGPPASGEGMQ